MADEEKRNGWFEWSRYVLEELKRLNIGHEKLTELLRTMELETQRQLLEQTGELNRKIDELRVDLVKLETAFHIKSGIWGLIGGAIPSAVIILYEIIKTLNK
jgi:hypothetical protein